ncbi:hypothetical protein J3E69DRAFT_350831, partial [Trichoderma sp. SZMC 28015]
MRVGLFLFSSWRFFSGLGRGLDFIRRMQGFPFDFCMQMQMQLRCDAMRDYVDGRATTLCCFRMKSIQYLWGVWSITCMKSI